MNLGALVTIVGQPVPGAGMFDFTGLAFSAGFKASLSFNDLEEYWEICQTFLRDKAHLSMPENRAFG